MWRLVLASLPTPRSSSRASASRKSASEYEVDKTVDSLVVRGLLPLDDEGVGCDTGERVPGPDVPWVKPSRAKYESRAMV